MDPRIATVPLHRLTIPSEKRTRTFIGLFNSFFSWFTDVSRLLTDGASRVKLWTCSKFETASLRSRLAVLICYSGGFSAVFIVTRAESYRFLDFYGCWAGGQLVRLQPRNAPYVYGTVKPARKHVFQTFFSRFVRYSYLSRRYSGVRCSVSWAV